MTALRPFALFGMGPRRKLLLCEGRLHDALTGELLRQWDVADTQYELHEYRARLRLRDGAEVTLWEDEQATRLSEGERTECVSEGEVRLPRFDDCADAPLLRRLHHEMLVNIVDGAPLPNLLVYRKPWYRDAAMVAMCLEKTGNLPLIGDWIAGLAEPYDRNNAGHCEPDNLGQALYLISLLPSPRPAGTPLPQGEGSNGRCMMPSAPGLGGTQHDRGRDSPLPVGEGCPQGGVRAHPLVPTLLAEADRLRVGDHIIGITDGTEHPVYQTKWLKFGLRALGLPDPWTIPPVFDSYSALFWMAFTDEHIPGEPCSERSGQLYPYLKWAEAHFHHWPSPMPLPLPLPLPSPLPKGEGSARRAGGGPPLTWEAHASEADYTRLALIGEEYVAARLATPHTWHAAEMFLYLLDQP